MSKRSSGIIGCKDKTSSWHLVGFPNGINIIVTLGQQYHVGEKHTVTLYTSINRHAGTQNKTKTKDTMSLYYSSVCNIGSWVVSVSMNEIYYNSHGCITVYTSYASSGYSVEIK